MTTSHSMESTTSRKIVWGAALLFAASAAACGSSPQSLTGTTPSALSSVASATDSGGTFSALKQGKGKGPDKGDDDTTPTTGGTPTTGTGDGEEPADDSGHGRSQTQIEGFTTSVTGTCPDLTIVINGQTIKTDLTTDFQRADCTDLVDPTAADFHLHIAAKMQEDALVATYVRMQGPKIDEGDDTVTPTTGTTP
jgi:hypothetical protein